MESAKVYPCNAEEYDKLVHGGTVPDLGDLKFASKGGATVNGDSAVVIAFTAVVDGKHVKVQCVTTLKVFLAAARCLEVAAPRPRVGRTDPR
jgi:hypothetical protein